MSTATQKKLRQDIKRASKAIGVGEKELAERAMRFYLASVEQEIALQNDCSIENFPLFSRHWNFNKKPKVH